LVGGRLALDAGWLLVIVLVLGLACATGIAVRRTLIEHGGGSVECGLRRAGDRRWRLGLAAYQPDELRWYPVFGLRLRPGEFFARRALSVVSRRPADPVEVTSVGSGDREDRRADRARAQPGRADRVPGLAGGRPARAGLRPALSRRRV
jgi:hypothetical protein